MLTFWKNTWCFLELTESTVKIDPDSENGSGSDKSDPIEILGYGDGDSSGSNKSEPDTDFDKNLPKTVTLLRHEKTGAKVYLIGTAHFSKESQADVEKVRPKKILHLKALKLNKSLCLKYVGIKIWCIFTTEWKIYVILIVSTTFRS